MQQKLISNPKISPFTDQSKMKCTNKTFNDPKSPNYTIKGNNIKSIIYYHIKDNNKIFKRVII